MKKLSILGLCLLAVASASAQKSLVKEIEAKTKSNAISTKDARAQLAPAFTNAETQNDAQTWFVAGTVEYKNYDDLYGKKLVGQAADTKEMGNSLINGYRYFIKALPLDSITETNKDGSPKLNKDGSIKKKTKYSKDIVKNILSHYNDFERVAVELYNIQDYSGAYNAWEILLSIPGNPSFGKDAPAVQADSIIGQTYFNMALAAWQGDNLQNAMQSFANAIKHNYVTKDLYDYYINVCVSAKDNDRAIALCEEAHNLYGADDSKYLLNIINDRISKEKYSEAQEYITKAIAVNPDDAELYDTMGILYQSQKEYDKAREYIEKAHQIDSTNPKFQLDLGRIIFVQAAALDEKTTEMSPAEYNKYKQDVLVPILKEAVPYLEFALKSENTQDEAQRLLRSLYYSLDDEENLKRIEAM
ncbi:MAG: tetratricopeptide repeat protein [Muribaculaceae bacterium]|nr:tetratricopeptide repeat protein [Muribaculaceae bacterium]